MSKFVKFSKNPPENRTEQMFNENRLKLCHFQEDMSLNSSSEFSQRTDRGGMQIGSDLEEGEKEVKVKQVAMVEEKEVKVKHVEMVEEKGEKMKGSEEKENIEKIIKDSNGAKDGPVRSSL